MESKHWKTTLDILKSYYGFFRNLNMILVKDMTTTEFTQLATLVIDEIKIESGQPPNNTMTGKNLKTPRMEKKTKLKISSRKGKITSQRTPHTERNDGSCNLICGEINYHQKKQNLYRNSQLSSIQRWGKIHRFTVYIQAMQCKK